MSNTNIVTLQSAEAFDSVHSSAWERLTSRVNQETLFEIVLVAVTIGLMTVLSYSFYHALQNYRVF